jgi:hypothetical protein
MMPVRGPILDRSSLTLCARADRLTVKTDAMASSQPPLVSCGRHSTVSKTVVFARAVCVCLPDRQSDRTPKRTMDSRKKVEDVLGKLENAQSQGDVARVKRLLTGLTKFSIPPQLVLETAAGRTVNALRKWDSELAHADIHSRTRAQLIVCSSRAAQKRMMNW